MKSNPRTGIPKEYLAYVTRKAKQFGWTIEQTLRYFQTGKSPKSKTKTPSANPRGLVKIYDKITRIEGQKGSASQFAGQKFFHNFTKPYPAMYGTPDKKTLIIRKGRAS